MPTEQGEPFLLPVRSTDHLIEQRIGLSRRKEARDVERLGNPEIPAGPRESGGRGIGHGGYDSAPAVIKRRVEDGGKVGTRMQTRPTILSDWCVCRNEQYSGEFIWISKTRSP